MISGSVSAQEDVIPPNLIAFEFLPTTIDTSASQQIITFTIRITDDLSGVTDGGTPSQVRFSSPSGNQLASSVFSHTELVSGDNLDGIYVNSMTLPQYCERGTWQLEYILLIDNVGNSKWLRKGDINAMGFTTDFLVLGDNAFRVFLPNIQTSP